MINDAVLQMLERYGGQSDYDRERILREIIQEIALVGLWRSKFFEKAAFYGGTALRIFYGLQRFSEDLDFTLIKEVSSFSWLEYEMALIEELKSYGFEVNFTEKRKTAQTAIKSAFLKTNTLVQFLYIGASSAELKDVHPEAKIRIKVELDTEPPLYFPTHQLYLRDPIAIPVRCVTEENLFAAKVHAAFFRSWKGRVKGRDWYDLVWFSRRKIPLNLHTFSIFLAKQKTITEEEFQYIAEKQVAKLNIKQAKQDILQFVQDQAEIESWSEDFFRYWIQQITFV